jgi:hypothetical protein
MNQHWPVALQAVANDAPHTTAELENGIRERACVRVPFRIMKLQQHPLLGLHLIAFSFDNEPERWGRERDREGEAIE